MRLNFTGVCSGSKWRAQHHVSSPHTVLVSQPAAQTNVGKNGGPLSVPGTPLVTGMGRGGEHWVTPAFCLPTLPYPAPRPKMGEEVTQSRVPKHCHTHQMKLCNLNAVLIMDCLLLLPSIRRFLLLCWWPNVTLEDLRHFENQIITGPPVIMKFMSENSELVPLKKKTTYGNLIKNIL